MKFKKQNAQNNSELQTNVMVTLGSAPNFKPKLEFNLLL